MTHHENRAKLASLSSYFDEQHRNLQSRNLCAVPQKHMSCLNSHVTLSVCIQSFDSAEPIYSIDLIFKWCLSKMVMDPKCFHTW